MTKYGADTRQVLTTHAPAQLPRTKVRRTEQSTRRGCGQSQWRTTWVNPADGGKDSNGASTDGKAPSGTPVSTPVKAEPTDASAGAAEAVVAAPDEEEDAAFAPLPSREDEALYGSIYGAWEDNEDVEI